MTQPGRFSTPLVPAARAIALVMIAASGSVLAERPDRTREAHSITLAGGRIVLPDGTLQSDMAVVVRDGEIKRLLPADRASGDAVRRFAADTVFCPGLIDLFSSLGVVNQSLETFAIVDPDVGAVDAIEPGEREFRAAIGAGITTAMVAPEPTSLVAGTAVTFRTHLKRGRLEILRDDGPLVFAFGPGVWQNDRPPTSRAGALHHLRELLEQTRQGAAPARVNAAFRNDLDALLVCASAEDVRAVRTALGDAADQFVIVPSADALDLAEDMAGCSHPCVLGPYDFASSRRELLGAARLTQEQVPVAFRGGFPATAPETLRISAAVATRYGMDPAAARRAMTIAAAEVAGVAGRVGSLAPGKDGDLVVFSGDPLRLDSQVLEVYVRGQRVLAAPEAMGSTEGAAR